MAVVSSARRQPRCPFSFAARPSPGCALASRGATERARETATDTTGRGGQRAAGLRFAPACLVAFCQSDVQPGTVHLRAGPRACGSRRPRRDARSPLDRPFSPPPRSLPVSPACPLHAGPEPGKVANKLKRHELHQQQKRAKAADKRERRTQRQEIRKELGDQVGAVSRSAARCLPATGL